MLRFTFEAKGTRPLLCHNAQLADPENDFAQQIAAIAGKRKKTVEDRKQISRLEWYGGLYTCPEIDEGPMLPTSAVRRALQEAGKVTKQGKQVGRAVAFQDLYVPIVYDGPRNLDKLFAKSEYLDRRVVKIMGRSVVRSRPIFPHWSIVCSGLLLEDVLDAKDMEHISWLAGIAEGLGDARSLGYGRADVTLKFEKI